MDMRVQTEPLIPRVQYAEETNFRAQMSGIASDLDELLVLECQRGQLRGQGKDHMNVAGREKLLLPRGDPAIACRDLTLWAVAIAAAVVRNGGTMPAAGALIEMTAECGGTTARNGQQHFDVLPAEPLAISFDKGSSCTADEIGHLKGRPTHLPFLR